MNPLDPLWPEDPRAGTIVPLRRNADGTLSLAVPNLVRDAVSGLASAISLPGQVASGEVAPTPQGATQMALALAGGGLGLGDAPEGALGIFAGRNAATADTGKLAQAMSLSSKGASPKEIWNQTGWFQDVDGQWKFEIPDKGAAIGPLGRLATQYTEGKGVLTRVPNTGAELDDMLSHPALFQAYPELRSIPVDRATGEYKGGYFPENDTMKLATMSPGDFLSTALHETQHAIQTREGFAPGGAPDQFLPSGFDFQYEPLRAAHQGLVDKLQAQGINAFSLRSALNQQALGAELPSYLRGELRLAQIKAPDLVSRFQDSLRAIEPFERVESQAFDRYRALSGEVEARNVQERWEHGLGPETAPWETPGYTSREQQITWMPRQAAESLELEPVEGDPFAASGEP